MEGNQTVPRAELQALISAVTFLGTAAGHCTIHIYSDNKAVVDGYKAGRRVGHGNMDDMWELYWSTHDHATNNGWTIKVLKVKAHTLDTPIKCDPEYGYDVMPQEIRIGNSRADYWADHAAEIASVYGRTPKPYGLIDALGWNVRKRLLAVCIEFIQKGKYQKVPRPPKPSKMQTLEDLGHIIFEGNNKLECTVCGFFLCARCIWYNWLPQYGRHAIKRFKRTVYTIICDKKRT